MQVSKYLNPMENQVFQFSVYNFHSMKTSLTKHVLLVWMGYKISSVRWSRLIAEIQRDLLSSDSFCASSPWFVTTEGTLAKYNPLSRPLLLPQPTIRHKTMFHAKDTTSLFTIEVHQYGGVATAVKELVTWVKTIYWTQMKSSLCLTYLEMSLFWSETKTNTSDKIFWGGGKRRSYSMQDYYWK